MKNSELDFNLRFPVRTNLRTYHEGSVAHSVSHTHTHTQMVFFENINIFPTRND